MNVIFFITDQQRADHLGCAGNQVLQTPHIDKLASEGVRFSNAYVANPTCMPNRASIMTGQYPNTCVRSFGVNLPPQCPTFPSTLREQGYATKAIGKMHLSFWGRRFDKSGYSPENLGAWMNPNTHAQMVADFPLPYYGFDEMDLVVGHGMILKGWLPYKGVLNVPLIFKVPGLTKAGSVSDSLVSAVDLAPTILNLCDVDEDNQSSDMQGIDVTPILRDPDKVLRDCCLVEIDEVDSASEGRIRQSSAGRVKYLLTDRYSLTVYDGFPGYGDLFDLQEDPHELNNLWDADPELRAGLVERLLFEVIKQQSIYPKKQAAT